MSLYVRFYTGVGGVCVCVCASACVCLCVLSECMRVCMCVCARAGECMRVCVCMLVCEGGDGWCSKCADKCVVCTHV